MAVLIAGRVETDEAVAAADAASSRASASSVLPLAWAFALVLAACGGNDDPAPADPVAATHPPAACATPGTAYATLVKSPITVGQSGGATLAGCTGAVVEPVWTQTGGPPVTLLAARSQTIAFDAAAAGRHAFRVDFRDAAGSARSEIVAVDVAPAAPATGSARFTLRASHSVRMGGNVSVRAWPEVPPGDSVQAIAWSQVEGPAVTLDTRDSHVALFVAPEVARDTVIRLRATLTTTQGRTASDDVLVLVERHVQPAATDPAALWAGEHLSRIFPWRPDGPHAGALVRCVFDSATTTATLCPLAQLPFLAQEPGVGAAGIPTIAQVMDRVVVSHEWAGRNFETFLREHDPHGHFRRMLRSVTAVVIGTHVRPSYYYAATGAIYLDADNFWLTPEERDTVNEAPDYRSGFGSTLQYTTLWRYVRGSTSLFQYYDPRLRIPRGTAALLDEAGWLLLHELAHALDFLPPAAYAALDDRASAWGNIAPRYAAQQLASDLVPVLYPLTSAPLAALAQVRFFGAAASAAQQAYSPAQVAGFFAADLATDDYAYASRREDAAMALEEFLMQHWFGMRRDFAIAPRYGSGATGSTITVAWGQRGRIGEAALRPRLAALVQQLVPWVDPAEIDRLPAPLAMRAGDSWTGNLVLPGPPPTPGPTPSLAKSEPTPADLWQLEQATTRRTRLQPATRPLPDALRR